MTRYGKAAEKKTKSVASYLLDFSDIVVGDTHQLFLLPKDAIITRSFVDVEEDSEASGVGDLGFAGGDELQAAVALDAVAITGAEHALKTGTGKTITFLPTVAAFAQGRFRLTVEYTETELCNGKLTRYADQ